MSFHIEKKLTYYNPMFLYADVDIIFYSFFFFLKIVLFLKLCNLMRKSCFILHHM